MKLKDLVVELQKYDGDSEVFLQTGYDEENIYLARDVGKLTTPDEFEILDTYYSYNGGSIPMKAVIIAVDANLR